MIHSKKYSIKMSSKEVSKYKDEGMALLNEYVEEIMEKPIKDFTISALDIAPEYFWVIPSNKSNFHPEFTRSFGGLVKHTVFASYLCMELSKTFELGQLDRDVSMSAIILHDTLKNGFKVDDDYGLFHPFLPRKYYNKLRKNDIRRFYDKIMGAIETHMGNINSGAWTPIGEVRPKSKVQFVVHLADYIASRPDLCFKVFNSGSR